MRCKLCDQVATYHVVKHVGLWKTVLHYCEAHVPEGWRVRASSESEVAKTALPTLQRLVSIMKGSHRFPTRDELRELGVSGEMTSGRSASGQFDEELAYLQGLVEFIEQHGRFPGPKEGLSDPF